MKNKEQINETTKMDRNRKYASTKSNSTQKRAKTFGHTTNKKNKYGWNM